MNKNMFYQNKKNLKKLGKNNLINQINSLSFEKLCTVNDDAKFSCTMNDGN